MAWEVEYTDEFGDWWNGLDLGEQKSVDFYVQLLIELGPVLRFPYCSDVRESRHGQMRELRVQHEGTPYRSKTDRHPADRRR